MILFGLLLATAAFALFALATEPHCRRWLQPLAMRRRMRWGAWALLALTFPPSITAQGWVFGPVLWTGLVMLGAGLVFVGLNLIAPSPAKRR